MQQVAFEILRDDEDAGNRAFVDSALALRTSGNTIAIATSDVASSRRASSRLVVVPSRSTIAKGTSRSVSLR